jgi:type I restriction enzyme S subunit
VKSVSFGSLCDLRNGRAFKPEEWSDQGTPIVRIQNLNDESKPFNYCNFEVEEKFWVNSGDLLFSWSGTPGTSFGAFFWNRGRGFLNQHIFRVDINEDLVDKAYLRYALNSLLDKIIDQSHGGVGLKHITKAKLEGVQVPLPPLSDQHRIAAILDKADSLHAKRREAIGKLDKLKQSVFLEMFGDPVKNPKGWPTTSFDDVVYFQEGPGVRNWQFRESGIKLINVINLVDGELNLGRSWRHLDPEEVDSKYKHFLLDAGDLVVASSGVTWGKVAEVKESHLPLCLNTSVIRMRSVSQKLTKSYLRAFIEGQGFQGQIERLITGSAQPNFGPSHLKKLKIVLPPLGIQERFEHAASQICAMEERLACQQASLKCLFEALQQKVFQISD